MSATWGCLSVMGLCALLLAAGRAAWLLALALRTHRALWGRRPRAVSPLLCASGDWAVVTGASDGIGKAYAIETQPTNWTAAEPQPIKINQTPSTVVKKCNYCTVEAITWISD